MDKNIPSPTVPALILGLGVTGLGALRGLSGAGIEVLGFDHNRWPSGRFSWRAKTFRCPNPEVEPGPLLERLLRFAPGDRRPVLIPRQTPSFSSCLDCVPTLGKHLSSPSQRKISPKPSWTNGDNIPWLSDMGYPVRILLWQKITGRYFIALTR